MWLNIVAGLLFVLFAITFVLVRRKTEIRDRNYFVTGQLFALALLVLTVSLLVSGFGRLSQIEDQENLKFAVQAERIYTEQANEILTQAKSALVDRYPQYEKDLMTGQKPANFLQQLMSYPEFRASETISMYVDMYSNLWANVYSTREVAAELRRNIRYRSRNPFYMGFLMPELESE
ncbi:hypothetical protein COT97_05735 [Candidatus Falkowbacteria bacterium CG10_big_fil_rev_8_21_14_0_10_39_11]|uniref:LemA family protein n=1 Tax=Candidatus Falkowbacteria bacterium CG10_big_fil_rev_8_21_14_0_10_39_11 TaxID=1974565 RepID=A0A2H0V3I1_9BACT|nr:MAG: hypothetical protein COT97_05735 [Candidatus Falkowbacteria bacterium CG10_big_fil_rev_8_21_14_0_10_39_11]